MCMCVYVCALYRGAIVIGRSGRRHRARTGEAPSRQDWRLASCSECPICSAVVLWRVAQPPRGGNSSDERRSKRATPPPPPRHSALADVLTMAAAQRLPTALLLRVAIVLLASSQAAPQRGSDCTAKATWPDGRDEDSALNGTAEDIRRAAPSTCCPVQLQA
eukprot:scaffold10241_cov127-Isochrysis_galbana.AAC.8